MGNETKICGKCHVEKICILFNKNRNRKGGLNPWCKECDSKAQKERRKKNAAREDIVHPESKNCSKCGGEKPGSEFYENRSKKDGLCTFCKECDTQNTRKHNRINTSRDIVIAPDFKTCPKCGIKKPGLLFSRSRTQKDGLFGYCKECEAIRQRLVTFGVSEEWYRAILASQGGACAICNAAPGMRGGPLCVDHNHSTGRVRGLLCSKCNRGLGYLRDSPSLVGKAIAYLERGTSGIPYSKPAPKTIKNEILIGQDHMCKICSTDFHGQKVCLDHCHSTGMIRGCLCLCCNSGLGQFDDATDLMQSAIEYLKKHEPTVNQ